MICVRDVSGEDQITARCKKYKIHEMVCEFLHLYLTYSVKYYRAFVLPLQNGLTMLSMGNWQNNMNLIEE